jgi:hypothetical protein
VDVGQFNQTVTLANERLTAAVKTAERRIRELDALMRVVQREAEDAFVTTAATLRGVHVGAATLRDEVGDELADDVFDDDEPLENEEALDEREETNGDNSETEGEWSERPRVRPRPSERA